ncbi:hypothetical protein [Asticcacaulis solisilvae]|uniref:hypothetical protein n=1 Tax=Asticcacaulis solisilvae TaxID=1217274 RepID=UPI003FD736C6
MREDQIVVFWRFVRGDMPADRFETWLYAQDNLEAAFGADLWLDLISADYRNPAAVFDMAERLKAILPRTQSCECVILPDLAVVPMGGDGLDQRFFATMKTFARHGPDLWWLYADRCKACGQAWMVAQEERIYDDYFIRRLTDEEVVSIAKRVWPVDFLTYEKILVVGRRLSKACRFVDPLSYSLVDTARRLLADRPDMTVADLAGLLGVSEDHAHAVVAVI